MMWIPLAVCVVVFLAYARSVAHKHACSGECMFCARDGAVAAPGDPAATTALARSDPDFPLSA